MNSDHPIQGLMNTAMNSIKEMVDVNTIVGDAVEAPDGSVIIPISRVSFGFAAGGAEYDSDGHSKKKEDENASGMPFGGGSGAGISINPVGFLVVGQGQIRLLPVGGNSSIDRLLDAAPEFMNRVNELIKDKPHRKKVTHIDKSETLDD